MTLTPGTIIASATVAAAGTSRGARDMRGKQGGMLSLSILNGATPPTAACVCIVSVAHTSGTTPATGAVGTTWKRYYTFGGNLLANAQSDVSFVIPPCCHVQVEFSGHTGQSVVCEAVITDYTDLQTV